MKSIARRLLSPLLPAWPDEGRKIVQGPALRKMLEQVVQSSKSLPRILNAGAGEGGYSPMLLSLPGVERLLETDFSYSSSKPTKFDERQLFFGSSLDSIPLKNAAVNLIFCTEVLEHVLHHEQALDEIARVVVSGGWLLLTVPTPPAVPDAAHVREGYRPEELSGMLQRRGFEVVQVCFCMYFFFRFLLSTWPQLPWRPRIVIRSLAHLDKWFALGPPMDLMILARKLK